MSLTKHEFSSRRTNSGRQVPLLVSVCVLVISVMADHGTSTGPSMFSQRSCVRIPMSSPTGILLARSNEQPSYTTMEPAFRTRRLAAKSYLRTKYDSRILQIRHGLTRGRLGLSSLSFGQNFLCQMDRTSSVKWLPCALPRGNVLPRELRIRHSTGLRQ